MGERILYKGVRIDPRPKELADGSGWTADFTLIEEVGPETRETPFFSQQAYPAKETAAQAAIALAHRKIDER